MIKKILKRLIPSSYRKIDLSEERILSAVGLLQEKLSSLDSRISVLEQKIENNFERTQGLLCTKEQVANFSSRVEDTLEKLATAEAVEAIKKTEQDIFFRSGESLRNANEAVWASIFHDAVQECTWLTNKKFFPGRWAAGYPALYVIYRVLENFKPQNILELGLGQSTKLIGQYAASDKKIKHTIVESDTNWIDFFKKDFELSSNTKVQNLECELLPYKESVVRQYKNFTETFKEKKFDFIFIDAPLGGDMKDFSRVDVALLLPQIIRDSFVIVLDDYNRPQEQHTLLQMEETLKQNQINYKRGIYSGQKQTALLCSMDVSFLASM